MNRKKSMAHIAEHYTAWKSCKCIYCPFKMGEHHITYVKRHCLSACITFPSLPPNIFKYKRHSFYKCFNMTGTFSPQTGGERFVTQRNVLPASAACYSNQREGIHLAHIIPFFSPSPPNCVKSIITRCSLLNFLANWIYGLKFSSMWLLIQRQTLAVQSCRKEKLFASVLTSCEADAAGASTKPGQTGDLGRFCSRPRSLPSTHKKTSARPPKRLQNRGQTPDPQNICSVVHKQDGPGNSSEAAITRMQHGQSSIMKKKLFWLALALNNRCWLFISITEKCILKRNFWEEWAKLCPFGCSLERE